LFDSLQRLEADDTRPEFDCGDSDLNEFFKTDSKEYSKELLAVTYLALRKGSPVAYFSVLNDAIKKQDTDTPVSAFKRINKSIPRPKQYKNIPAVKIGRLAVCAHEAGKKAGSYMMDFIKYWFKNGNKTGCRFILVDAYNKEKVIKFYQNNGFKFMTSKDAKSSTRIMYFDLIEFEE
jgi:GNAT superfamily N-acetyltransferase